MNEMNSKGLRPGEETICNVGGYAAVVKSRDSKAWLMDTINDCSNARFEDDAFVNLPYATLVAGLHSRGVDNKTILNHLRIAEVAEDGSLMPCLPNSLRG